MGQQRLREGFAGQDMYVIPRPILGSANQHPLIRALYPTDIGWFPEARHHYRSRAHGANEDHLMMCVGGHGFVIVDGKKNHLETGQILIIPRHLKHRYWAADDVPWSIYWMHFRGGESGHFIERMPGPGKPAPVDTETQTEAVRLFRDCLDTIDKGYTLPNLIYVAQSARHILSLLLFRNPAFPMVQRTRPVQQRLASTLEYMLENIAEPLRLEDFAQQAGLSVSHFSEQFRDRTGQSPISYFTQIKVQHACRLLDLTEKPVKAIAIETGYRDPYYFSRVFKKHMGLSPENYRAAKKS
ncbi:MAG: AraC family transcriptional regulator [Xanthomonadales bacterium]|jgi:AraC-like DNA-binding protein|nr:AraC family transcriptional regulator [Xanthomonadales bacterium]